MVNFALISTSRQRGGEQPGGLQDSSRWSQTTGKSSNNRRHPERVRDLMDSVRARAGTPSGCEPLTSFTGGLRFAPTSGYFVNNPAGCKYVNSVSWEG